MSRNTRFTVQEIKLFLKSHFSHITLLENQKYINRNQELEFSCENHGLFRKSWIKVSKGYNCPSCGKLRQGKKSLEELVKYLEKNIPHIKLNEQQLYVNSKTKMLFTCQKHGEFETTWNSITRGSNCQKCGLERKVLKSTTPINVVLDRIKNTHGGKIELVNPNEYVNSHSKLKFKCEKNHPIWVTGLYSVLQGTGCPKCSGKNISTKDFIDNVKSVHKGSISLSKGEKYKGRNKKIKFDCNNCKGVFYSTPSNIIFNKSGCPKCKGDKLRDHFRFTTNEVLEKIKNISNGRVIPFENQKYLNQKSVWKFKCENYPEHPSWETSLGSIFNSTNYIGCRFCLGEKPILSTKDVEDRLYEVFNKKITLITVVDKKLTLKSNIKVYCSTHNITYTEKLSNVLKSKGCNKCSSESYSKNRRTKTGKLLKKIFEIHRNNISVVDVNQYVNTDTKIEFKCNLKKHGLFESTPHSILGGSGCPVCNMSKGERKILFWLRDKEIKFEYQYRIKKNNLSKYYFIFDFYLPKKKIFIEFDGRQHYEPIEIWGGKNGLQKVQKNDSEKNLLSEKMGFKMIRIPYFEYDEIENILNSEVKEP